MGFTCRLACGHLYLRDFGDHAHVKRSRSLADLIFLSNMDRTDQYAHVEEDRCEDCLVVPPVVAGATAVDEAQHDTHGRNELKDAGPGRKSD